ncbi:MAG: DUF5130 family protein [Nocardioidaceae bacterium]
MPVPVGEGFSVTQRQDIDRAVKDAERASGRHFSVHVGRCDGPSRAYAEQLHAQLPHPDDSILVQVDPEGRTLEIVTGPEVTRTLSNRTVAVAAVTMQSAFETGDIARGLVNGVQQLGELARVPKSLHTDTP